MNASGDHIEQKPKEKGVCLAKSIHVELLREIYIEHKLEWMKTKTDPHKKQVML